MYKKITEHRFTLIELLVVMAILSILLSLLMPSLRSYLRLTQNTECINNLKQLGMTYFLYADDNYSHYPDRSKKGTTGRNHYKGRVYANPGVDIRNDEMNYNLRETLEPYHTGVKGMKGNYTCPFVRENMEGSFGSGVRPLGNPKQSKGFPYTCNTNMTRYKWNKSYFGSYYLFFSAKYDYEYNNKNDIQIPMLKVGDRWKAGRDTAWIPGGYEYSNVLASDLMSFTFGGYYLMNHPSIQSEATWYSNVGNGKKGPVGWKDNNRAIETDANYLLDDMSVHSQGQISIYNRWNRSEPDKYNSWIWGANSRMIPKQFYYQSSE